MKPYAILNRMPAEAFLNPDNFITGFDTKPISGSTATRKIYAENQYQKGRDIGKSAIEAGVSASGTWWAKTKEGAFISSHEGIGYHANTADLWRGFLDSECRIVIHRLTNEGIISTVIKE